MVTAELQTTAVKAVISAHNECLKGPGVKPSPAGGPMFEYNTQVQLGGASNAALDAKAKAQSEQDLRQWGIRSCREITDLVDAGVRSGKLSGHALSPSERKQKIDDCIAEVNR
jgi:hypothetical protein